MENKLPRKPKSESLLKSLSILQTLRNKAMGRDLSHENLKVIAQKYRCRTDFLREDCSAYTTARRLGILDDITSHMAKGIQTNWPQNLLFEVVKYLFPENTIRYNDRQAIKPKEIDVYVVGSKIGFEYDGKNFHQIEENDKVKDDICLAAGIKLYRIKEVSKVNPLPHILIQLQGHGFDISSINPNDILLKCVNSIVSEEELVTIANKYCDFLEFKKKEPKVIKLLKAYGTLEKHTKHMVKTRVTPTICELRNFLLCCKNKNEVFANGRMYQRMIKLQDPQLMSLYASLVGRQYTKYKPKRVILDKSINPQ